MMTRHAALALLVLLLGLPVHAGELTPEVERRYQATKDLVHQNRLAEAQAELYDLLQVAPDFVDGHRLYIDLLAAQGRSEDAIQFYKMALDRNPGDPAAHYLYGRATNDPKIAEAEFEKALQLDPDFAWAHHGLGAAAALRDDIDGAIAGFEKAIELRPDLIEAHNHLASLYLATEREDEAVAAYRRAIEMAPGEPEAYFYLGTYLAHHERYDEALELLEESVRLDEHNPMVYLELGTVYFKLHREQEALDAFDEGLKLDPRDEYLRDLRAVTAYVVAGGAPREVFTPFRTGLEALSFTPEAALASFDEALALAPDFALAHLNRGICLAALQRNTEAEEAIRRAIDLEPGYAVSHASLAVLMIGEERYTEAEASLQQALALDPANVEALRGMGMVYLLQERAELAASYFLRATKLTPADLALRIELAGAYVNAEQWDKAEQTLRGVLRADPTFNYARHQLAALLVQQGQYDDAVLELEELQRHVSSEMVSAVGMMIQDVRAQQRGEIRASSPTIRVSQIFVKDRALADDLVARARAGEDFAALARAHSKGPTASKGGDIGRVVIADLQPVIADALAPMGVGDVSSVLELPAGFLVLKRTE